MFPYYLSIGMTAAQFWYGDPWLAAAYRRANEMRIQRKSEEMWLQGAYIFQAVSVALNNAFRKKGAKMQPYLQEPIQLIPLSETEKELKAERERQKAVDYFNKLKKKWETAPSANVPSA